MHRSKIIKKRTKNRETLLRNLRKGKARQEDRANFQIIPYPPKFSHMAHMHRLYGDLVVMEQNETLISEISLCNNFKYYKNAQVFDGGSQKVVKYQVESKVDTFEDWRAFVENLEKSEADSMKQWAQPIRAYSERYEAVLKEFQGKISSEREQVLNEINAKSEKAMQTILKTYPCMYIKSQLKDGHIQTTEICYSEKYLAEMGYGIDDYTSVMFREGIPLSVPLDGQMGSWIAKMRLEKHLTADPDGHQTPESDSFAIMKNGFLKKLRFKVHYYACYEKGVPGFVIMGVVMARQKPSMSVAKPVEAIRLNPDYVDFMRNREKEQADFMLEFYDVKPEQKYTNLNKVCKIKEVTSPENL